MKWQYYRGKAVQWSILNVLHTNLSFPDVTGSLMGPLVKNSTRAPSVDLYPSIHKTRNTQRELTKVTDLLGEKNGWKANYTLYMATINYNSTLQWLEIIYSWRASWQYTDCRRANVHNAAVYSYLSPTIFMNRRVWGLLKIKVWIVLSKAMTAHHKSIQELCI